MNRDNYIRALDTFCEDAGLCANCPIGQVPNLHKICTGASFTEMTDDQLEFFVNFLKLSVEDESDPVNRPSHYTAGKIECIDAIEESMTADEYAGFLKGQVIKYLWRYRLKGKPVEDLKKARFYLDRLIQGAEKKKEVI